ncbi:MAG: septation ring formation regulator EzrA [Caldibacillus sp.]
MEFIIGTIILIILLIIGSYVIKRKYFAMVDYWEERKIDLMNRPVLDEVGKIKTLRMMGETEEYFERWRKEWDIILTERLPSIEEWLYDAEDYIDHFRFKKAKEVFARIERVIEESEREIEEMIEKINQLIDSEARNNEDYEKCQELFKKLRKDLLAHQYAFGIAAPSLEQRLKDSEKRFAEFNRETENGNYLTAREIILGILDELKILETVMESIPLLLNELQQKLPEQIKEIKYGIKEMEENQYFLEHLELDKKLSHIEQQIDAYLDSIKNLQTEEVQEGIQVLKDEIEKIYQILEAEVHARRFVQENKQLVKDSIEKILQTNRELNEEIEEVIQSYHISETDIKEIRTIDERMDEMKKSLALLLKDGEAPSVAYSAIKEKLGELINTIADIEKEQQTFKDMLQTLRKDELEAREKIQELRKKLQQTIRTVQRSNVPGIPADIETRFLECQEALKNVFRTLEQKPLVMPAVRKALQQAEEAIHEYSDKVQVMIENVYLIEKIIQYGNRYRSTNETLNQRLLAAEEAFYRYDYEVALEEAATAVEAVEPGALKKIERYLEKEDFPGQ